MTRSWVVASDGIATGRRMYLMHEVSALDRPGWHINVQAASIYDRLEDAVAAALRIGRGRPLEVWLRGNQVLVLNDAT